MSFSDILPYFGIGIISILGIVVLIWLLIAGSILLVTKGLPKAINHFFAAIVTGNLDAAYAMTTPNFQKRTSKKQFTKFVKANRLKHHKRVQLPLFNVEGDWCPLDLTVELTSGEQVPLYVELVKDGKTWAIDGLERGQNTAELP
ncbi:hypothetical protein IQ268_19070 [Oculatella sp. LEGE 06141]|uniref:DUF4864 domain-containing protein n=1 Tax=Oculatella sp. LEGE 06141 TaxID=1828648 RepID=UPI00188080F1|nr:hypothetical protein [Oculatella sp. LEGE 06141]MBE9180666.1 hypothetical protein [Oculatella sp. LEGE 06141]